MANALSGRSAPNKLEGFHVYLLMVLGFAFFGAGIAITGLVSRSPAAVGIGAGAIVAAGLISILFALMGSRLRTSEETEGYVEKATFTAPLVNDPEVEHQRPAWPPKTSGNTKLLA
jgi:hypothetical protein